MSRLCQDNCTGHNKTTYEDCSGDWLLKALLNNTVFWKHVSGHTKVKYHTMFVNVLLRYCTMSRWLKTACSLVAASTWICLLMSGECCLYQQQASRQNSCSKKWQGTPSAVWSFLHWLASDPQSFQKQCVIWSARTSQTKLSAWGRHMPFTDSTKQSQDSCVTAIILCARPRGSTPQPGILSYNASLPCVGQYISKSVHNAAKRHCSEDILLSILHGPKALLASSEERSLHWCHPTLLAEATNAAS